MNYYSSEIVASEWISNPFADVLSTRFRPDSDEPSLARTYIAVSSKFVREPMNDAIYLRQGDELVEMTEKAYEYESVLQEKLADYPRLLAGGQMSDRGIDRWALIAREKSVPDKRGGGERWSADHLFVDQDAVPTIVEVKRSENTEIRRSIVGQMLDYVAHASMFWDAETLEERFVETCEELDVSSDEVLATLVDEEEAPADFWADVEKNLRSNQIRLVFVADDVPSELKRVVEFLNEAMREVEVLAIEVVQYANGNEMVFVPRLYGQTEEAKASSSTSTSRTGSEYVETEDEMFEDLDQKRRDGDITEAVYDAFVELYEFAAELGDGIEIGGAKNANFKLKVAAHEGAYGGSASVFTANVNGELKVWPAKRPYTGEDPDVTLVDWELEAFEQYLDDFRSLDGVSASDTSIRFDEFVRDGSVEAFEEIVTAFVEHCRDAARP